jgi:hypothetical protein
MLRGFFMGVVMLPNATPYRILVLIGQGGNVATV